MKIQPWQRKVSRRLGIRGIPTFKDILRYNLLYGPERKGYREGGCWEERGEVNFSYQSFTLISGGVPDNQCGVPVIERKCRCRYTSSLPEKGDAFTGKLIINCRYIGRRDRKGRKIYQSLEGGVLFVFNHRLGNENSFDSGCLCYPNS